MGSQRILGLSRSNPPTQPMLKSIPNRQQTCVKRDSRGPLEAQEGEGIEPRPKRSRLQEEPAFDAPPLSSDEEDAVVIEKPSLRSGPRLDATAARIGPVDRNNTAGVGRGRTKGSRMRHPSANTAATKKSGNSETESDSSLGPRRGDMIKTTFGTSKNGKRELRRPSSRIITKGSAARKRRIDSVEDSDVKPQISRSRMASRSPEADRPLSPISRPTHKSAYGKAAQRREPRSRKPGRHVGADSSPEKSFINPNKIPLSDGEEPSPVSKARNSRRKKPSRAPSQSPERVFEMPRRLSLSRSPGSLSPITGASQSLLLGSENEDSQNLLLDKGRSRSPSSEPESIVGNEPVCPMCNLPVEQSLLDDFSKTHKRMGIVQQQKFCDLHRRLSARDQWIERGYPEIDWLRLDLRISKHHDFLRDILRGKPSHFTDVFYRTVKSGGNKTMLKTEESLTPGYYGPRGQRAISDNIIKNFSDLLHERAIEDRLIAARGDAAYLQSVLVPEVAVRLIMEDMDLDAVEARSTLVGSASIGELLNEDKEDAVSLS